MKNEKVKIVEVGPRDGLQNEPALISVDTKLAFIEMLASTGLKQIEAASFVSPRWVPQMADAAQIIRGVSSTADVVYSALVPNLKGLEMAIAAGVKEVAIFTAASEQFCQKNTNCSIAVSLQRIAEIIAVANTHNIPVRGYVSTVLGCPYQGDIAPSQVVALSSQLFEMGCFEISLGDTIGVGTPDRVKYLLDAVAREVPVEHLAVHFHDTYGQALANIYAALQQGIRTIDSSIAGLGGCPYATGASGNVATEDVVYLLQGLGFESGLDLPKLVATGHWISEQLNRANHSKVAVAMRQ